MQRFAIKLLLFVLLTGAWVLAGNRLFRWIGSVYKGGDAQICERKRLLVRRGRFAQKTGRTNVVFLGGSRIMGGVLPILFQQMLPGRSIAALNLALPAVPIGPHYFELLDYLSNGQAPEYLVLAITPYHTDLASSFDRYAGEGARLPDEPLSYLLQLRDTGVALRALFPLYMYGEHTFEAVSDALLRPGEMTRRRALNEQNLLLMERDGGYHPIPGGPHPDLGPLLPDLDEQILAFDGDPYVRLLLDLAAARNIQVLLIEPPARAQVRTRRQHIPWQYAKLLACYKNARMRPESWRGRIYEDRLFTDNYHVIPEGARRFTRELAAEFAAAFPAP